MKGSIVLMIISKILSVSIRRCSCLNYSGFIKPSYISSLFIPNRNLKFRSYDSEFPQEIQNNLIQLFDDIRDDKIQLEPKDDSILKRNLNLRSYVNLSKYTRELNSLYYKSTFVGCTTIERKFEFDSCILHFRGYERGESLCLCFNQKYLPLFPSCKSPFKGVTERSLDYFEYVLSGLTGLRVTKIHTPYDFRNIISIDFADSTDLNNVLYRIIVLSGRVNKLLLVDNSDDVVLGSSECVYEDDLKKDGHCVGKKLEIPPPKKIIPKIDETFDDFISNFKGLNHYDVVKAMLSVYEGLDHLFVNSICQENQIEPVIQFYRIPDIKSFYEIFINKIKLLKESKGPYEELVKRIYELYGSLSPSYMLNRKLEKFDKLAQESKKRFEKLISQCEREENYDKLNTLNEKLETISDYQVAVEDIRKSQDPKKLENLEDFHEQILMINDLEGYKLSKKRVKEKTVHEANVKTKSKKVGKILNMPINDRDDSPLLIVGKNAKQNEVVTLDLREKGDLWLHTKDCPGGHVLLRNYENDKHSIQIAADVASYYSKYKNYKNVQVVVTDIESVKKEKNSQLGAVMVQEYRTVVGDPERGRKFVTNFKTKSN